MNEKNIVLVGMPGSGKTTVAAALGARTGRNAVDTDALLESILKEPVPEFLTREGEARFRDMEHMAVVRAGTLKNAVIATGGGVVLREDNYAPLAQNGIIFFLRRSLNLLPTADRPLSRAGALEEMYRLRLPRYLRFAKYTVDNDGSVEQTVDAILEAMK